MIDNAVKSSLTGRIPVIIFVLSILFGLFALKQTPREEEPQIVVPMLDIICIGSECRSARSDTAGDSAS